MEIQHLRYFYSVCVLRNFSKAAEACFVTPQGISMAIRRLEEELKCKLFERAPKKEVILTEHAKYLMPHALRILNILDTCEDYFLSGIGKEQWLDIMLTQGALEEFASEPIEKFKKDYTDNVHLEIMHGFDSQCEATLDAGQCELALISGPMDEDRYDSELVFSTRYGVSVNKNHKLAQFESIDIKHLDRVPLTVLLNAQKTKKLLSESAKAAGVTLNVAKLVGNAVLTQQQADINNEIGITTESVWHRYPEEKSVFVPFDSTLLKWNLYLVKRKNVELSPAAAKLWQLMIEHRDNHCG